MHNGPKQNLSELRGLTGRSNLCNASSSQTPARQANRKVSVTWLAGVGLARAQGPADVGSWPRGRLSRGALQEGL